MKPIFSLRALGGLGQIGANMQVVYSSCGEEIVIDCGILFPYNDAYGINHLMANTDVLKDPKHIIITHGHEDHIGALIHLVKKFPDITIWASPFTTELIQRKNAETAARWGLTLNLMPLWKNTPIKIGDYDFIPIQVNHSIPETFGIVIKNSQNSFSAFYASDFKVDFHPGHEPTFDFDSLKKWTKGCSIRPFFADSTNIISKRTKTPNEIDLIPNIEKSFSHSGRIFATLFASNTHRIRSLFQLAKKYNRKVVLLGRSVKNYTEVAINHKYLDGLESTIIDSDKAEHFEDNELLIIASGCQGDQRSTLRRLAFHEDQNFKIGKTDLVMFSSKAIPGNEKKVSYLINALADKGAKIVTSNDETIHASGHPCKDDLIESYKQFDPTDIIPVHGETHFLIEHAKFAKAQYPKAKSHLLTNGDLIDFFRDGTSKITKGDEARPNAYANGGTFLSWPTISQRKKIASLGLILISINENTIGTKKVKWEANFFGVPSLADIEVDEDLWPKFLEKRIKEVKQKNLNNGLENLRNEVRRFWFNHLGHKPVVKIVSV